MNIFCLLPFHFLFICCVCFLFLVLSFSSIVWYIIKSFSHSCFEPSQLALPAFFSLFLFEIYHWIINFKFYPPHESISLTPTSLPSTLLTLTLILNLPSLSLLLLLPKHIYNCLFCFFLSFSLDNYYYAYY